MGLGDFIRKQFIDVIHWTEDIDGVLAYRFPMRDFEIQYGAQLTVRESQAALLVDQGVIADQFGPGRYRLTTETLPVLTYVRNWTKLFESPFKSDVYFFSTRLQLDQKWGTPNPLTIRDKEFGAVRLRAFGIYAYRISDPKIFHTQVSGTRGIYSIGDLEGQLRSTIVASITDVFGEFGTFIEMAANQDEFGALVKTKLDPEFARMGLSLHGIQVQNISVPDDIRKILDQRVGMGIVGDMGRFTQFQTAQSIPTAAANEGGFAGIGAGLGAGLTIGQTMASGMAGAARESTPSSAADVTAMLEKLHELLTKGVLTQEEFDAKKAEMLKKLT